MGQPYTRDRDRTQLGDRSWLISRAFSSEVPPVRIKKTRQNKKLEFLVLIQSEPKLGEAAGPSAKSLSLAGPAGRPGPVRERQA